MKTGLIVYCIFCVCSFFSLRADYLEIEDLCELKILNPSFQKRKTAKIILDNKLSVYLISDEEADQSAAALAVNAGSWNNPKEFPGMAHFLEHMLFMGTKKYPKENEFMQFISDNGGKTNAFTAFDRTGYLFSIHHDAFEEGLDRFSEFFIHPLFDFSSVQKELHIIDQEFSKNLENDSWRLFMIEKEIGNPDHPNAKFSTGNSKTLGPVKREDLVDWFHKNYSANLMHLIVYSSMPIDKLKEKVVQKFSLIPNKNLDLLHLDKPLTLKENSGHFLYVDPVKNTQRLYLKWELDQFHAVDLSKSKETLAFCLQRGQKNSLEEILKQEKLIEQLTVDTETLGPHHAFFQIAIDLTKNGIDNLSTVIQHCMVAIQKIKKSGIPPYLFHEMQTIRKLSYEYQSRKDAFEYVMDLIFDFVDEDLATYPQKTLLANEYSSQTLQNLLQNLTPTTCQYTLLIDPDKIGQSLTQQEKWMGGRYVFKPISKKLIQSFKQSSFNQSFQLPPPNPFIPTKLNLLPISEKDKIEPTKILENESGKLYYFRENQFLIPEASLSFQIQSPLINGSCLSNTLLDLTIEYLYQTMNPLLSCGRTAGIEANFSNDECKFFLQVKGFSEKIPFFLEEILKEMTYNHPSQEQFENLKETLLKGYQNGTKELPFRQAFEKLKGILYSDYTTEEDKLETLKNISYDAFLKFQKNLFEKTYIQGLIAGNLSLQEAESIWLDVKHILGNKTFAKKDHTTRKIFSIPSKQGPFFIQSEKEVQGNGIVLLIHEGEFTFTKRAAQEVLSTVLQEAFFNTLRTKQKTGYIAQSWDTEVQRKLFQSFAVQSSTHEPIDLLYRFEFFLEDFLQNLKTNISLDRFEKIKENIITKLKSSKRSFYTKIALLNRLLFEYEDLEWIEKRIEHVRSLSYEDFMDFAKNSLAKTNKSRLAVLMKGKNTYESFNYKVTSQKQLKELGRYKTLSKRS